MDQGKSLLQGLPSTQKERPAASGGSGRASNLSTSEVGSGLKEALAVGAGNVVGRLGRTDGFNADPRAHIPLPDAMRRAQSAMRAVGMSGMADDLELRLNRAAEAATPKAKALLLDAISTMTLDDAMRIYNGPQDSATRYFEGRTRKPLAGEFRPVVDDALADAGAVQLYDQVTGRMQGVPMVPDLKTDLTGYVVDKALDAVFHYLGQEEASIRANPAARTTDLLKRVFGG